MDGEADRGRRPRKPPNENDVLAYMNFPAAHRVKLHSTNGLERLNREVKRRADVVGIFPNEASIMRLVGAVLMKVNDEWQLQHRYLSAGAFAGVSDVEEEADRIARQDRPFAASSNADTYTARGLSRYTDGPPQFAPLRWT